MSNAHITIEQAQTIANSVINKVKNKGYAVDADLGTLAKKSEVAETDLASELGTKINGKADSATTLAGYNIGDAYTKTETENKIAEAKASVCRPGGSLTAAQVVSSLLVEGNVGKVYNLTEDVTTTADFVEGAGHVLPAGTNIQVIDADTTGSSPTYKFDTYAGAYGVATQSGNGLMSATDKTKLDNADVTAYTNGNGININNHEVSANVVNSNGLSVGVNGIEMATVTPSTSGAGGSNGAMTAAQAEKLANIETATDEAVNTMIAGLDNL